MNEGLDKILDVKFDHYSHEDVLKIIDENMKKNDNLFCISTINIELVMIAQKNNKFKNYLNNVSNLNTIDGIGIINVAKWYGINNLERVCGSDLAYEIAKYCADNNKKYFILGASQNVSTKAKLKLKKIFPNLNIENYSPPYTKFMQFSDDEDLKIKSVIESSKADVLCVAFGAPKQELWINDHIDFLNKAGVKLVIGLGGSFDFIAGKVKRAPMIFRSTGNEWLYRLVKEPKTRFKRQITTIPLYYLLSFLQYIKLIKF